MWLRKCQEAAPEQALYRALLARSLGTVPQFRQEAIQHFEKAIELDPWREPVYLQFAELLEAMAVGGRARAIYTKLLEFNPASDQAHERLAALDPETKADKIGNSGWFGSRK